MAHATTNTAVDDVLTTYLNKDFISDLEYNLQYQKFTMKGDIPTEGGNVIRFNEFSAPQPTGYTTTGSAAITEGSTTANEITGITTTPSNLTMAEFGEFFKETQLYQLAAQPGTLERLKKRLMDGCKVSIDTYTRGKYIQSTNIFYATGAQTGGTATGPLSVTALGASTLIGAKKVLRAALGTPFKGVSGHPDGKFAAILSEKQELDVVTEVTTGRVYWSNAVVNVPGSMGQQKFVDGYLGVIYGVATYTTNNSTTATYTATVEVGFVCADGGVLSATIAQMQPRIIVNDVNSPYKNVNSVAWHAFYEAALHSSVRVVKLYSSQ
jgi:hypothetical protein